LVISKGAGSGAQNAIGTGVMGGMISGTALAVFFVPVFFVLVRRLFPGKQRTKEPVVQPEPARAEIQL
ncbi:partial Antibiotic efflux pump membrane transporter ArpB, partial [Anaerolineae bacterium]